MNNHYQKAILFFVIMILIPFVLPVTAFADMGPKPSITVIVENPPEDEYYLDLLVSYDGSYKNLSKEEKAGYDQTKLKTLETFEKDGWYPGLAHGTNAPMFGRLTGEWKDGVVHHRFGYIVPDQYRIIVVTPDHKIKVSEELQKKVFHEHVVLDYNTMSVMKPQNILLAYTKQFGMTFIPTILIEGAVLLLFGFSLKRNGVIFLVTNFVTQLFMTAVLGTVLIKYGLIASYLIFIPVEIVIFIFEAVVYAKGFKQHSIKRRIVYALTANLLSAVVGLLMISLEFLIIFG